MRGGAQDSISINNIGFYFIINIFPSGRGEITPRPKHNYVNRPAAGRHQEAAQACMRVFVISPGVGVQDRMGGVKEGQGLWGMLFLLEDQLYLGFTHLYRVFH